MFKRDTKRRSWLIAAACIAASMCGAARGAEDATAKTLTDEQVVAAMQKASDFLLRIKKENNWESGKTYGTTGSKEHGGETALVLYALLHAGESLQDNPEYRAKLNWRSKDLSPVVEWLSKNMPEATYAAGLEASALTMLPKVPGQYPKGTLDACRSYLTASMGKWGGYNYTIANPPKGHVNFAELWAAYCADKSLKKDVDDYMVGQLTTFGGQQTVVQDLAADLQGRIKESKDATETAKFKAQLKELQTYSKALPKGIPLDKELADARRDLDKVLAKQKAGEKVDEEVNGAKKFVEKLEAQKKGFYPIGDLSNGQYGTLGAWALADYGMELPTAYWETQDRFWRTLQKPDGSWAYDARNPEGSKDSMGVAGIASLFVCQEFLDNELRLVPKPDKNIDAGLAWLNKAYLPGTGNLYYMYGVERVGLASGLKFFGTTNWYLEDAAYLVKHQKEDGTWALWSEPDLDAAYGLLFLARGRNPVVFNKLQYNGPWNARPRDDAYVTRWMSKHFEKPINWQVVNLQVSAEEWLDAPILLITGSTDPKFTKEDLAKLRSFVNAGGMIFSTADGGKSDFTLAIKKYAGDLVDKK
jgi:hypothetical protein